MSPLFSGLFDVALVVIRPLVAAGWLLLTFELSTDEVGCCALKTEEEEDEELSLSLGAED